MHEFAFSVESVAELRDEIQPLLAEHWELVSQRYSRSTLSTDVNLYQALEDACALRLFTVRSSGDLVGYASVFVITHLHRRDELTATVEAIYLRSAYRGLGAAERFLRYIEDALRVAEVRTLGVSVQDVSPGLLTNRVEFPPEHASYFVYYYPAFGHRSPPLCVMMCRSAKSAHLAPL